MPLVNASFMINNAPGVKLYNEVAKSLPIIDYHCHLDARDIYENKSFNHITELWLAGDHYKWRAMRANGIDERYITGDASADEKFRAWALTVESCFGNPLYHWTHLELHAYFGCEETLNSQNWQRIMAHCNALIGQKEFSPRELIKRSNVEAICTTDSLLDSLHFHQQLKNESNFEVKVLPTFRPDELFVADTHAFSLFIDRFSQVSGFVIKTFNDFDKAIGQRIDHFHRVGCRISDHGPQFICWNCATQPEVESIFCRKRQGKKLTTDEQTSLNSAIYLLLARHYKQRDWAMQIHFGAIRDNNSTMLSRLGQNKGFDSIMDQSLLAVHLNQFLDALARNNALPKIIFYNLNANDNDIVASTMANFQTADNGVKSPLQLGSGWWFNDTRRGMENQLNTLADQGLLMHFVGMLTDSRSFVSYTRHDYFRRIVCNLIGEWVVRGEVPDDQEILSRMVRNICHDNAERYFRF
ncbi:MAG: glucuronate isomerase [Klebsiella huaxiensis]|uniref:glucuronate isomerase n=1 Tax=Klebsiella huaxiensis TaxID=2153354 RepID=UPI0026F2E183|nr:glucuronate isomerase [Klebsiella huaxiensis]WEJ91424.1 MAG: glucuronate isomerase [Klebsiella huaxiensis]